jgi:hypothetical protein
MKLFTEWMSIRQMNEPLTAPGTYQFSGTYEKETIPNLIENSKRVKLESALKFIPDQYKGQFGGMSECQAGKGITEENKEILWVCNESGTVYIFEKT